MAMLQQLFQQTQGFGLPGVFPADFQHRLLDSRKPFGRNAQHAGIAYYIQRARQAEMQNEEQNKDMMGQSDNADNQDNAITSNNKDVP